MSMHPMVSYALKIGLSHSMTANDKLKGGIILNNNQKERDGMNGRLSAMAPLANPYVPFQLDDPPKYEPRKALVRGTLYPGLDLPFMGMVNKDEKPITPQTELQVLGFALHELALYLDTHRDDREALELYRQYQRIYHDGIMEYSQTHGPMSHGIPSRQEGYAWLDDPWPWEYGRK